MSTITSLTRRAALLSTILIAATFAGCAGFSPAPDTDSLRQRAQAYWKARVAGDPIEAWVYEELRARHSINLKQYASGTAPLFLKAEVTGVSIEKDGQGKVVVDTEYMIAGLSVKKPIKRQFEEPWVWIDGAWYHVHLRAMPGQTH